MGAVLMVQGCASSVGKSLIVTGLCRLYARRGISVAPFKAQNLALNSFVTRDGHEIGRAQVVQAEAAGIEPTVDMNPILLKPESDAGAQVVLMGKPVRKSDTRSYFERRDEVSALVQASLERLRTRYDLVLIEGAGSPAEINLRDRDIANMHVARMAGAPVLLVGDIDRGGVFAHLVGTLELLEPEERAHVAGLLINKFRGDRSLVESGIELLEERTGLPMLGLLPYLANLRIADEDSVSLDGRASRPSAGAHELDIAVLRFPYLSNHDDFLPLEREPGVVLRFVESVAELGQPDLLILPGTKNTRGDLAWLRDTGLEAEVQARAKLGHKLLGICGGYQMLGRSIEDPLGVEGEPGSVSGLGLLPVTTRFGDEKTTKQVSLKWAARTNSILSGDPGEAEAITGFEIHMGEVAIEDGAATLFVRSGGQSPEGVVAGSVAGTLVHGLFENDALRRDLLDRLRELRALESAPASEVKSSLAEYDRLADALEANLDLPRMDTILERSWPRAASL